MTQYFRPAFGLMLAAASLLLVVPTQAQTKLGGMGAPQSEACKAAGGTENGQFCVLENGQSCESMTLARDNVCKDENGNIIDDGEDYGSNLPPEESGGEEGGEE